MDRPIFRRAAGAAALAAAAAFAHAAADEPWPTRGWTLSSPEAQGMSSSALAKLVEFGAANGMDSLLVARHGRIVAEAYYAPFRAGWKHAINSATKGIVGTLVGIAVQQGRLPGTERPLLESFAAHAGAAGEPRRAAITLQHLLDMTSGIDWREPLAGRPDSALEMERERDWVSFVLARPMARAPGEAFDYNSGNSHLLSAVIGRATGDSASRFAREQLFAPLGISDVAWREDPQGVSTGGFGLAMQPRDMAKIGLLYLRGGRWEGRSLLPPGWVERTAQGRVDMGFGDAPAFRYANGWWSVPGRGVLMAVGSQRQLIVVMPALDVVAVTTGRHSFRLGALVDAIVAASPSREPLPPDPAGEAELAARVRDATSAPPTTAAVMPASAAELSGRRYAFGPNPLGVESLRLRLDADAPGYEMTLRSRDGSARRFAGPIGFDGRFRVDDSSPGRPIAARGRWVDDRTLEIVVRTFVEPEATYTLAFEGRAIDVAFRNGVGFAAQARGEAD